MNRQEFIKVCGLSCAGLATTSLFLQGCSGTKYLNAEINGDFMEIPLSAFQNETDSGLRDYLVVENSRLSYPIAIYRHNENEYTALLMRCTHQGSELRVFGDRLECPAHGSEFTNNGSVQNGPADNELRTFPVLIESEILKIDLR
ncbi:MAG: Rieske (2Fe-2S) protein [Balneola sp.]|jgi:nitrite reductase/ring-hydroxylating ferredoxin subunit